MKKTFRRGKREKGNLQKNFKKIKDFLFVTIVRVHKPCNFIPFCSCNLDIDQQLKKGSNLLISSAYY